MATTWQTSMSWRLSHYYLVRVFISVVLSLELSVMTAGLLLYEAWDPRNATAPIAGSLEPFVIGTEGSHAWRQARSILGAAGLQPRLVLPVSPKLPALLAELRLLEEAKLLRASDTTLPTMSRLFTHRWLWRRIAMDDSIADNEFIIVLDDFTETMRFAFSDEGLPRVRHAIAEAAEAHADVVWLDPDWSTCDPEAHSRISARHDCVRGSSHAYAVRKRRARWLYDELRSRATRAGRASHCVPAGLSKYSVCSDLDKLMPAGLAGIAWALHIPYRVYPKVAVTPGYGFPAPSRHTVLFSDQPSRPRQPQYDPAPHAYVVALDGRYERVGALLQQCGLQPQRVRPVPIHSMVATLEAREEGLSPYSERYKYQDISNKLSHRLGWAMIEHHPGIHEDGFGLIFEEDAALNEAIRHEDVVRIINTAAAASYETGLFWLGVCWFHHCWRSADSCPWSEEGVEYGRCVGRCSHAYGIFKWRAAWLYEELRAALANELDYVGEPEYPLLMDATLDLGLKKLHPPEHWPVLAGHNLTDHDFGGVADQDCGTGIFYQVRTLIPTGRSVG